MKCDTLAMRPTSTIEMYHYRTPRYMTQFCFMYLFYYFHNLLGKQTLIPSKFMRIALFDQANSDVNSKRSHKNKSS